MTKTYEEYEETETLMAQIESSGGVKHDEGKRPFHLLSPWFLFGMCDVLGDGAKEYGERNWEKGLAFSRCFGAVMRHMWAWWCGEKNDPKSGRSHLFHAACEIMFLAHFESMGQTHLDDSPGGPKRG